MATFSAKPSDITRQWQLIDASQASLGRVSTNIATLLTGKHKPIFTSHIDCGDFVVVINSDKLKVTGNKIEKKIYYRHSQYPGSLKETLLKDKMETDSTQVIYQAVRGMLPKNKLMDARLKRLKIYKDEDHPHEAQKPKKVSIK
jgi:large subunit ribosomal protein L13